MTVNCCNGWHRERDEPREKLHRFITEDFSISPFVFTFASDPVKVEPVGEKLRI